MAMKRIEKGPGGIVLYHKKMECKREKGRFGYFAA